MIEYKGYIVPETVEEIRRSTYHEHWAGDWLVVKRRDDDPGKRINFLYERGTLKEPNVDAVIARVRSGIDRRESEDRLWMKE